MYGKHYLLWTSLDILNQRVKLEKLYEILLLMMLNCFLCDGAWGYVANIVELPAASIFIKEEYLSQKQDQHDQWNVVQT
jgi:hypothetical protein